jgi:hypothetical protein
VSNNAARIARRAAKEVADLPDFGKSPIKKCLLPESIYLSPISSPRDWIIGTAISDMPELSPILTEM